MNATAKHIIESEIDKLQEKCADLSFIFNSQLRNVKCTFEIQDPNDTLPGWYEDTLKISVIHESYFREMVQNLFVYYNKELRDLQTFLAEQSPAPAGEPGPIIKTHIS